jgi:hypothetical protein
VVIQWRGGRVDDKLTKVESELTEVKTDIRIGLNKKKKNTTSTAISSLAEAAAAIPRQLFESRALPVAA